MVNSKPRRANPLSRTKQKILRAAVVGAIRTRKIRQKDLTAAAKVYPQYVYDVLHGGKPLSARMAAIFRGALSDAFPELSA